MASQPKITQMIPEKIPQLLSTVVQLVGEEFEASSVVKLGSLTPTISFIDENRINMVVPNTLTENVDGEPVQVQNTDGGKSNLFNLIIHSGKSKRDGYTRKVVDQRIQPLPPPLQSRRDIQRVAAGSQFTGKLPIQEQGDWKDGSAPTQGGRWAWAEDVFLSQFLFRTDGAEPNPRGAGSGLWLYEPGRAPVFLFDLASPQTAQLEHISVDGASWEVKQGQEIRLITSAATKEMEASLSVRIDRPYL